MVLRSDYKKESETAEGTTRDVDPLWLLGTHQLSVEAGLLPWSSTGFTFWPDQIMLAFFDC